MSDCVQPKYWCRNCHDEGVVRFIFWRIRCPKCHGTSRAKRGTVPPKISALKAFRLCAEGMPEVTGLFVRRGVGQRVSISEFKEMCSPNCPGCGSVKDGNVCKYCGREI